MKRQVRPAILRRDVEAVMVLLVIAGIAIGIGVACFLVVRTEHTRERLLRDLECDPGEVLYWSRGAWKCHRPRRIEGTGSAGDPLRLMEACRPP